MLRSQGWFRLLGIIALVCVAIIPFIVASAQERLVAVNTLILGLSTSIVAIPLAVVAAMICLRKGLFAKLLWATLIWLTFTPIFMHVSAWDSAFGKLGWIVNLGGSNNDLMRWASAIWIHASAAIPQTSLIIWFTLHRSGRSIEEQALLDANETAVFFRITLPRLIPVLLFCLFWIFVGCSREIAVTDIYRIGTFAEQIYLGYALGDFAATGPGPTLIPVSEFSLSVLASIACLAFALAWALFVYLAKLTPNQEQASRSMPRATTANSLVAFLLISVLLLVPLSNLVIRACKKAEMINGEPAISYTMGNLIRVVSNVPAEFQQEFSWSFIIAAISATLSMTIAMFAVWLAKESQRLGFLLVVSFSICIALPGPLIGSIILNARDWIDASWFRWFFDRTIIPPLLANLLFCFPFACALSWIVVENVSKDVLESAKLEGASSLTRLSRFVIGANPWMVGGFLLLLFACCFGELSASQLAIPPGIDTIPRRMLGLLHSGVNDLTAGLTIVLSAIILAICSFGYLLSSWNNPK